MAADGTLYAVPEVGPEGGTLIAFTADGAIRWSALSNLRALPTSLAIGRDGTLYAFEPRAMYAVTPDGSIQWSTPLIDCNGANAFALGLDGTLYTFLSPGCGSPHTAELVAIAPDGSVQWTRGLAGFLPIAGPTVGADGTLYYVGLSDTRDGGVLLNEYVIALDPTGRPRWQTSLDVRRYRQVLWIVT